MEYQLQSDDIKEIAQAMCKAQSTISGARKDSKNPFFNSDYADLGSVTEAIRESATANDLSYTQANLPSETGITVVTTVMHSSGQWLRGFLFLPATKVDPQQFGSAMTYARRYGLAAAFGVVQEDDDANGVSQGTQKPSQPKQKQTTDPIVADLARELKDELLAFSMGNVQEATDRLKELTVFGDAQDKWMKYDQIDQCSEKWLKQTLAKVKKLGAN